MAKVIEPLPKELLKKIVAGVESGAYDGACQLSDEGCYSGAWDSGCWAYDGACSDGNYDAYCTFDDTGCGVACPIGG
jgi:hypothetical protein